MSDTNTKGQGFVNISTGISNIFGSLFGNNGAGDELSVILNRGGYVGNYDPNMYAAAQAQYQRQQQQKQTMFILLALGAVVALFFVFKK